MQPSLYQSDEAAFPLDGRDPVTILMVDDQPSKLLSYEVILQDLGERLVKANSGREALDYLLKGDVAVVLMDVSMPEIDGFELADMMRQHPRFQKTPIIFVSAVHLSDIDRIRGYQSGAVDYISVPVVPEVLAGEGKCLCGAAPQEARTAGSESRPGRACRAAKRRTAPAE